MNKKIRIEIHLQSNEVKILDKIANLETDLKYQQEHLKQH